MRSIAAAMAALESNLAVTPASETTGGGPGGTEGADWPNSAAATIRTKRHAA